jgi:hypothetical protein
MPVNLTKDCKLLAPLLPPTIRLSAEGGEADKARSVEQGCCNPSRLSLLSLFLFVAPSLSPAPVISSASLPSLVVSRISAVLVSSSSIRCKIAALASTYLSMPAPLSAVNVVASC